MKSNHNETRIISQPNRSHSVPTLTFVSHAPSSRMFSDHSFSEQIHFRFGKGQKNCKIIQKVAHTRLFVILFSVEHWHIWRHRTVIGHFRASIARGAPRAFAKHYRSAEINKPRLLETIAYDCPCFLVYVSNGDSFYSLSILVIHADLINNTMRWNRDQ